MTRIVMIGLAVLIVAMCSMHAPTTAPNREPSPPIVAQVPGGALICDPSGRATGYRPVGGKIWALNAAARARVAHNPDVWTDIPHEARANISTARLEDLRTRAASLCD